MAVVAEFHGFLQGQALISLSTEHLAGAVKRPMRMRAWIWNLLGSPRQRLGQRRRKRSQTLARTMSTSRSRGRNSRPQATYLPCEGSSILLRNLRVILVVLSITSSSMRVSRL